MAQCKHPRATILSRREPRSLAPTSVCDPLLITRINSNTFLLSLSLSFFYRFTRVTFRARNDDTLLAYTYTRLSLYVHVSRRYTHVHTCRRHASRAYIHSLCFSEYVFTLDYFLLFFFTTLALSSRSHGQGERVHTYISRHTDIPIRKFHHLIAPRLRPTTRDRADR